jgi:hypothetical protein
MISSSDIQQQRSPKELYEFVHAVKSSVRSNDFERHRGITKQGWYKEFLDEIVPLSYFSVLMYPETWKIQPVLGNQGFDAKVLNNNGEVIDHIEVTSPQDGAFEASDARIVVERGYGQLRTGKPGEDFDTLFPFVLETCLKKAKKDYTDCTLVVAISPFPPFRSFEEQRKEQLDSLMNEMIKIKFKAKKVFLLVLPDKLFEIHFHE